ncbi:MAG TPA: tripartite tricarboxylate transporter substrate binding protein [Burkholderiales bacterium]|nr:tripartite tricarboxylate transporter substrate binding protein [Burkholderiales bacterium]
MRWLALALACFAALAAAEEYPRKPIRILIAFGAGGASDAMARTLTDRITPSLGQPFVLENRPGAGGNIAMDAVAKAPPDGYLLVLTGPALVINPALYSSLSFDPQKDLAPVATLAIAPFALFASATLPVNTVGDLVALGRTRKMNYASVGPGTAGHLAAVLFGAAAGVELTHVPYRSIQLAVPDLVSGDVQFVFNAYPPLAPMAQAGKLRLLGFSSPQRLRKYPDIPTLSETGLPGFDVGGWYIILAPRATPKEVVARLNAEFNRALKEPAVGEAIEKMGFEPAPMTLAEAARFVAREAEKWNRSVKLSGAKAD